MVENKYYIYRHLKTCGEVFYIGIGGTKNNKRAYNKNKRSAFWKSITEKYPYEVQILKSKMTLQEACELEIALISYYGRRDLGEGNLVNLTDGGEGLVGYKYTEEQLLYKKDCTPKGENHPSSRILISTQTGVFYYTVSEAAKAYNKSRTAITNMLTGHRRNKTDLVYAENQEGSSYLLVPVVKDYLPPVKYDPKNHGAKKVQNKITLEIWDCIKDAAEANKIKSKTLSNYLNGLRKNKTPLEFYKL